MPTGSLLALRAILSSAPLRRGYMSEKSGPLGVSRLVSSALAASLLVACAAPAPAVRTTFAGPDAKEAATAEAATRIGSCNSPAIGFNHLWAVVDEETARAASENRFLREFAAFEVRTTTANDRTWTGRYVYGRTTYFELFAPSDRRMRSGRSPEGDVGIALGADRVGDLACLTRRLQQESGATTSITSTTRLIAGREVPWFLMAWGAPPSPSSRAVLWGMEYLPIYFDVAEAAKEPPEGPDDIVSRERYIGDEYRERLLRDLTRVELAVTAADFERMESMFEAAGFIIHQEPNHVVVDGPDVDLHFSLVDPEHVGLRGISFQLNRPAEARSEQVGRSVLTVGPGTTATWRFAPR